MTAKESLQYFKNQALFCQTMEICGLLGRKDSDYTPRILKNKHSDPKNHFAIDPLEYLKFVQEFEPVAVFHSHIMGDSQPSEFDKINSENTLLPFLIYSLPEKKFSIFKPEDCEVNAKELEELL